MIIDLANVASHPKAISLTVGPQEIDLEGELVRLEGNAILVGEAQRVNQRAHFRGSIDADVLLDCTRCLEPVARHLAIPFRAIFVDAEDEEPATEKELGDEQLDESIAESGQIDLTAVVREQLLLALPLQIFCSEDCKGLCPQCGANRNLIDCNCADDEIDPRWAALKNLK